MVYFLRSQRTGLIKIGRTSYYRTRFRDLCREHDERLEELGTVSEDDWAEKHLHVIFKSIRVVNEWFEDSPKLRAFIAQHAKLDLPEADSPRNEVLVPLDRTIAQQCKKVAESLGIGLACYLDGLLRQAVYDDYKKL
mgnify:CR=1 FL=1